MLTCLVSIELYICRGSRSMGLQVLLGSLVDKLCYAVADSLAVLQRGPMDPPLIEPTPSDVAEEVGSPREEHIVGQDHGALPQQTRTLQHLQQMDKINK